MRPHRNRAFPLLLAVALATAAACSALKPPVKPPSSHPEELPGVNPVCSRCHEESGPIAYADFDHRRDWAKVHGSQAFGQDRVCSMCHRRDYCNDCHGARTELKPSVRRQGEVDRVMPHRGDYISRHRIDARIDPAACFGCHGNPKRDRTCVPCHG